MPSSDEVIVTEDLTKRYGRFTALDHLDLRVRAKTCVGFLGPNGAGKTTAIKILTGLIRPSAGRAFIHGVDAVKQTKTALMDVGALVETPEFYPYLTPQETLAYLGRLRGMATQAISERAKQVLERVRLRDWTDKRIGTFSKGMKQRLALAQALLHDPSLLILDEPTMGLDPRGMFEVRELVRELRGEGRTIFMSSHMLGEVQEVCDSVALLNHGRLLLFDRIENLNHGATQVEIRIVGQVTPALVARIGELANVGRASTTAADTVVVSFTGDAPARSALLDQIHELGVSVASFRSIGATVESIYLSMIEESVR